MISHSVEKILNAEELGKEKLEQAKKTAEQIISSAKDRAGQAWRKRAQYHNQTNEG